jgi:3-phosphoshikimate 1-carboxyvinyltransferase
VVSAYPPYLDLGPLRQAAGTVRLPGSKSISNRTLLLAALAEGVTDIHDLLSSDDVDRMLEALEQLGVQVERSGPERVRVTGCAGTFPNQSADLFLGNAGTALRPLTAALALNGGRYKLSGVTRMHERPIGDLVDALRVLGADIRYLGKPGFPPLEIRPAVIRGGGRVSVRGEVSSQFLTALLMALPKTGTTTAIDVEGALISKPYIEITLKLMALFGVEVTRDGWASFTLPGGQRYRSPGVVHVEGDASSASYFLAAGAIGGGPVRVEGVGRNSVQGDVRFAEALAQMGAQVQTGDNWIQACAPADEQLKAFDLDLNHIPDAAMTLAVAALFADGPCWLRNIASWRVKETDRLTAMATELRKVGAQVQEGADYLMVSPPAAGGLVAGAWIHTYDDHRMAMCFSLVALGGVQVRINDPKCVAKTFPDYFERFAEITATADRPVIAIDGPSASGKGTVARQVAEALGFHFLDSGALYRLVGLAALKRRIDLGDAAALTGVASRLDCEFRGEQVILEGEDVTREIRTEAVSNAASQVAAVADVRRALLERQRAFRRPPGLVADGRDMGSIVFPDASVKVFLTAGSAERARRRHKQLIDKGIHANLDALLQDINQRDARDAGRSVAPLQKCADAHLLDTTALTVEQAVNQVLVWCRQALKQAPSC